MKHLRIDSNKTFWCFFKELFSCRYLLYMLTWRDLKLRYSQTALGVTWVVLQPLLPVFIFAIIFGKFAHFDSEGIPYILFAFSGLIPWLLFSQVVQRASNSLVADENLLTKVYFPRMALPLSKTFAVFIDFLIGLAVFLIFLMCYHNDFSWRVLMVPVVTLIALFLSFGFGILFAAWNVYFGDFKFILPFLLQIWMYASPVIFSSNIIPAKYHHLFLLNPMVGIIDTFRWCFFKNIQDFPFLAFNFSFAFTVLLIVIATWNFKKVEMFIADIV